MASLLSSVEYKHYRRLICCKIPIYEEKAFLKIIQRDGWKITRFGKRGAKYSIIKELSNYTRYHMRLFKVQDHFLILVHQEPSLRGDLMFHIKGFLNAFSLKEADTNEDKLELSNYQAGSDYFKQIIESDINLKNMCDFRIKEHELKIFTVKYGFISLKTPVEIFIEDLKESLITEERKEFISNIRNIFNVLGFKQIEVNATYLIFESLKGFTILIQPLNLSDLDLNKLGTLMKSFRAQVAILICSKSDTLSRELSQKLRRLKISVLHPSSFLRIFTIYRNTPLSQDQLEYLFSQGGLITPDHINAALQPKLFQNFLTKTIELFRFLQEQSDWVQLKSLEYEFIKGRQYHKDELKSILQFLTYPLINLVLTKKQPRRFRNNQIFYRAITNFDEIQFRLKNIQQFLDKLL